MNPLDWRKTTWVLIIWSVVLLIWTVTGRGIGVYAGIIVWLIGFLVLSLVWLITWLIARLKLRVCPHCGEDVKKGRTTCKKCGYDFTIGGKPTPEVASGR